MCMRRSRAEGWGQGFDPPPLKKHKAAVRSKRVVLLLLICCLFLLILFVGVLCFVIVLLFSTLCPSSFANILIGKKELVALLKLSF